MTGGPDPLELPRRDGTVVFTECSISDIPDVLASRSPDSWLLLTNLSQLDIKILASHLEKIPSVLGFHAPTGFWLLLGAAFADLPPLWRSKKATPLGIRRARRPGNPAEDLYVVTVLATLLTGNGRPRARNDQPADRQGSSSRVHRASMMLRRATTVASIAGSMAR